MLKIVRALPVLIGLLLYLQPSTRAATVINFDNLNDGDVVANQYPGLTFSNATILTAGISLNEFEFPPHSGTNVASDNGGPVTISFSLGSAVQGFFGYFTYGVPLTLRAFDRSNNQVAVATSHFSNNESLSGSTGSSPNELLQVNFAAGISKVTITGDPGGSSFTLDDATINTAAAPNPTPVPPTLMLMLSGLALASFVAFATSKRAQRDFGSMKTLAVVIAVLVPFAGALWLSAAPQTSKARQSPFPRIDSLSSSRTSIPARTTTTVTLTARINHPSHIRNSVNLIRLNASGRPTILGQMHDDGKNGDAVADDRAYTIQLNLKEPSPGEMRVQVSTAFHGRLKRVLSDSLTLTIKPSQK